MKIFRETIRFPEFERDLKKLIKRFRMLEEDLDTFIRNQLKLYHKLRIDNKGIVQVTDLQIENVNIYKAKKFACRSLNAFCKTYQRLSMENKKPKNEQNQLVIYQTKSGKIEFRGDFHRDTVWGNLNQIAELFGRDKSVISRHIKNIFKTKELDQNSQTASLTGIHHQQKTHWQ